jgi:lactoylglutathione lyase
MANLICSSRSDSFLPNGFAGAPVPRDRSLIRMTVNSLTPDLMVEDIAETVDWYERMFDAEVVATLPSDDDADHWWVQIQIDDASLMLQERESLTEKISELEGAQLGGSVAFYTDVDDATALHDDLDAAGAEIIQELHETDFGWRQFAVSDCNGYVLWFGEKLDEGAMDIGRRQRSLVRRHHG